MLLHLSKATAIQRLIELNSDSTANERLEQTETLLHPDEVEIRFEKLLIDLFRQAAEYGIIFAGVVESKGTAGIVRMNLDTSDRQKLIEGLTFIRPLALSVEEQDLGALIPNRILQMAVRANWKVLAPDFNRISLDELLPKLEAAAVKVSTRGSFNGAGDSITYTLAQEEKFEREALAALKAAGIEDPLDSADDREEQAAKARRDRDDWESEQWLNRGVPEPTTPDIPRCQHNLPVTSCMVCWAS